MKVFINGLEKEIRTFWFYKKMSHKQVCELSGLSYSQYLTVTYGNAYGKKKTGILTYDQFVKVKNGTKISVANTSNA